MTSLERREVYDVAVVGFGPSGAVAAGLLAGMGLSVYVCDRSHEVYDKPRAIAIDHEVLRVFQQLGVEEQVARYVEPFTPSEYYGVDGRLIKRLTMVAPPYPLGYTPSNVFTQPPVEAVLREHVQRLDGARVELGAEVVALEQDAEGVSLTLRRADGEPGSVRARFVVACDGASSTVRDIVGLPLEDLDFDEPWLVVDVLANEKGLAKLPSTSVQYCEPDRPCTLVIGPGNHRRWEISLKPGEDPRKVTEPDETWKLLARWLTPDDGELWRQASYRFHALVAERWRNGRVFIAGDAAHQQPPFLGQGMCQGVRDVANLSWKLRAVLKGEVSGAAADSLLDSYGLERGEHVRQLTARIKDIGAVICERDDAKARERDARLLEHGGGMVVDVPRQDVLPRLERGFLSSIDSSARGTIFPQPWVIVNGERVRFDRLAGDGWLLVLRPGTEMPRVGASGHLALNEVQIGIGSDPDAVLTDWFRRHECVAALVRPDRYVFGVASTVDEVARLVSEADVRMN